MSILSKKSVILNFDGKEVEVEVYLKEVAVRNNKTTVKCFSRMK